MAKRHRDYISNEQIEQPKPSLRFKARHPEQELALECLKKNGIAFLTGPAGTAKTHVSTWYALSQIIEGATNKILITRPAITSGADIGFLPGTVEEKMKPFLAPITEARDKIGGKVSWMNADQIRSYFEIAPLCYIRGRTIENAILIVDEAQNLTPDDILTIATRIGENGKIIFCGDTMQNDLYGGNSVLERAAKTYDGASRGGVSVGWYRFSKDAIVRSPITGLLIELSEGADWYLERNKRR